jgi:hypothetical protein
MRWSQDEGRLSASKEATVAIAIHRIQDRASFEKVSSFQAAPPEDHRRIAGIYFYLMLDCLVDLAYKVACDFFARPHLYTKLGDASLPQELARLRARCGSDERIPSREQRDAIYFPLLGQTGSMVNGDGDFPRLTTELNEAAAAFAERVFDTGVEMLRERVRTTHRPLQEYLEGIQGDSLTWARDEAFPEITEGLAYKILRDEGVVAVFGVSAAPVKKWPQTADSNGDKLVAAIAQELVRQDDPPSLRVTRERFSNLQRTALRGAEALATILDYDESLSDEDQDVLITKCYTWGSALRSQAPPPVVAAQPAANGLPELTKGALTEEALTAYAAPPS